MKKNVLIIGASGDIGSEIAYKLGTEGYQLILHYNKNKNKINELSDRLLQDTILSTIQADLSEKNDVKRLLSEIIFHVDHIIFASGHASYGLLQDETEQTIEKMIAVHVNAPILLTKSLLPQMIQERSGNIIFITSIWGDVGASSEVLYSTVKGSQNSFVKSLAKEVGPTGISVNAISPGFIDTKMNQQLSPSEREEIIKEIPLKRAGNPEEVANLVRFLLEDASNYIHGEIIGLKGGW